MIREALVRLLRVACTIGIVLALAGLAFAIGLGLALVQTPPVVVFGGGLALLAYLACPDGTGEYIRGTLAGFLVWACLSVGLGVFRLARRLSIWGDVATSFRLELRTFYPYADPEDDPPPSRFEFGGRMFDPESAAYKSPVELRDIDAPGGPDWRPDTAYNYEPGVLAYLSKEVEKPTGDSLIEGYRGAAA